MPQLSSDDNLWCRRYRAAENPAARLVCLPYAGGSAPYFRPTALALDPSVDVVAVQYPGRQERHAERPIADMAELADRLHGILSRESPLPLTLFGHSMGAVLGFELARRFEADGRGPVHLFASGRRGPSTYRNEAIHLRDDAGIMDELRRGGGTAAIILNDEDLMRAALPALRADYKATETYRCAPDATVACPITALTGESDPKTTVAEAEAWKHHTTGTFTLRTYPGGHFYLADQAQEVNALLAAHFAVEDLRREASSAGR